MLARLAIKVSWLRLKKLRLLLLLVLSVGCQTETSTSAPTGLPTPAATETTPAPIETIEQDLIAEFAELLNQAELTKAFERQPSVDRYFAHLQSAPITGDGVAMFIWRGEASSVQLAGDMNNWDVEAAPYFNRLEGTDLWYLETVFEVDARLDYKFVINGDDWRLDPLNPRTIMGGFGPNSELVMPGYKIPDELLPTDSTIATGTIESHTLDSLHLGQTRTFFVYVPAGQIVGAKTPSIYINDGGDYLNLIDAVAILDKLITDREIPPLVAVFIPPINRDLEYTLNDDYASYLADELVPFIQRTYDTDPNPARTGTLGASMGGLAALFSAITRSDVFGLAAGQSGAYSVGDDAVIDKLQTASMAYDIGGSSRRDLRMYLVVGTYETAISGDSSTGDLLGANRRLADVLESTKYEFKYDERPEGHSWGLWKGTLGQALSFLFNLPDG
ncbi:MAG: alpha/beta hydrolase-fold protein [Candidatus Promineifilaceae bacterium]